MLLLVSDITGNVPLMGVSAGRTSFPSGPNVMVVFSAGVSVP